MSHNISQDRLILRTCFELPWSIAHFSSLVAKRAYKCICPHHPCCLHAQDKHLATKENAQGGTGYSMEFRMLVADKQILLLESHVQNDTIPNQCVKFGSAHVLQTHVCIAVRTSILTHPIPYIFLNLSIKSRLQPVLGYLSLSLYIYIYIYIHTYTYF